MGLRNAEVDSVKGHAWDAHHTQISGCVPPSVPSHKKTTSCFLSCPGWGRLIKKGFVNGNTLCQALPSGHVHVISYTSR